MNYLRIKKVDFNAFDSRAKKGDKAEIHGISMGDFQSVQDILTNADGSDQEQIRAGATANLELVTLSCHSLTVGGEKIAVNKESLESLDALYFNLLLADVMSFHSFGESEKN
jgi:hypothetical protein